MCNEKINMTDKYTTRDGKPVRILCVDRKGGWPVVALVASPQDVEDILIYGSTGNYWASGRESNWDLVKFDPLVKFRNLPVDTPVWVKAHGGFYRRHFADLEGVHVRTFLDGKTSHSETVKSRWNPEDVFLTEPEGA